MASSALAANSRAAACASSSGLLVDVDAHRSSISTAVRRGGFVGFVVATVAQLFPDQYSQVEGADVDGSFGEEVLSAHHGGPHVGEVAVARDLEAVLLRVEPDAP